LLASNLVLHSFLAYYTINYGAEYGGVDTTYEYIKMMLVGKSSNKILIPR